MVSTGEVRALFGKRPTQAGERAGLIQHPLSVLANLDAEHAGARHFNESDPLILDDTGHNSGRKSEISSVK